MGAAQLTTGTKQWEAYEDASSPACDGRNILILESIVNYGNREETQFQIAQQVLMQHPSSLPVHFTAPGQCPSLTPLLTSDCSIALA